jgi:hypothetical protein
VATTDREADRPEPEDLSPTQGEIQACLKDVPTYEEVVESLYVFVSRSKCMFCVTPCMFCVTPCMFLWHIVYVFVHTCIRVKHQNRTRPKI